jgi:hypothetical protein
MLTYFGDVLPQGRLAYIAFRLAAMSALVDIDKADLHEEGDEPPGFLGFHVPLLRQVPVGVQLELLSETWAKHRAPEPVPATLLDEAVLYAACETAADLAEEEEWCRVLLRRGPRRVKVTARTPDQLLELFYEFWGDTDWTLIEAYQDVSPERMRALLDVLDVDEGDVRQFYDALGRGRVSPALAGNLEGLLTPAEVTDCLEALKRTRG